MALRQFPSMEHDDEDLYDLSKGMPDGYEPPQYPMGLMFCITKEDMEDAAGPGGEPGATMHFAAMGTVTSVFRGIDNARVELELTEFAGEDGKFFQLHEPAHICLCERELEKMDLEADCDRGDLIHLIGTVRMEHEHQPAWGDDMVGLQITELDHAEDESEESREG